MNANFMYPTVMLEHCAYAALRACVNFNTSVDNPNSAINATFSIAFANKEAFQIANSTWSAVDDLVLVLPGYGCNVTTNTTAQAQNYTRTYWMVQNTTFQRDNPTFITVQDGGYVDIQATSIIATDGLADGDLVWGT